MTWLDRYRVIPRFIAVLLGLCAVGICGVVCYGFIIDLEDGEPTTAMATVLGSMVGVVLGCLTATIAVLGKREDSSK